MLVSAAAISSKPGCLRCHGEPDKVPEEISTAYGRTSGYHYKDGDIVGLELVGVPLADVDALATTRSLVAVGLLTLLFALIFATINILVRRNLISPIIEITDAAHAIVKGDLDRTLDIQRNDEIGDLARSVELLRRSFAQVMKRFNKTRT
jgi:HAMP domain-containing protein